MKASELRIGNYVNQLGIDNDIVICIDSMYETISTNSMIERSIDDFNPIPLTKEWLEKFGFKIIGGCYYHSDDSGIEFFVYDEQLFCEFAGSTFDQIQNVHDLQNLHYAIYKEELKIK